MLLTPEPVSCLDSLIRYLVCDAQELQVPGTERDFCLPPELMRDRQPVYERVPRNIYSARLKPKRMHRDDMAVCNCAPVLGPPPIEGAVIREVIPRVSFRA